MICGFGKQKWLKHTTEAEHYKKRFLDGASRFPAVFFGLPASSSFALDIWLYTDRLKTLDGKEYKSFDASNRIKFLEDCLKEATGIDDKSNLHVTVHKDEDPSDPRVEIYLVPLSETEVKLYPTVVEILEDLNVLEMA